MPENTFDIVSKIDQQEVSNAIQQALQGLFPDILDLSALESETPHCGLTVLTYDGNSVKLNRLLYTEWKF